MPRYIDVEWLMEKIREREYPLDCDPLTTYYGLSTLGIFRILEEAPTVSDDEIRGAGEWIVKQTASGKEYTICSVCETEFKFKTDKGTLARLDMRGMAYCPNCGAKMEVSEDGD